MRLEIESIHESGRASENAAQLISDYMFLTGQETASNWALHGALPPVLQNEVDHYKEVYRVPGDFLIAFSGDKRVGCVGLHDLGDNRADVRRLWALQPGVGIGSSLMDACESVAKQNGFVELMLDVLPFRSRAIEMYKRRNYCEAEPFEQVAVPMIFMKKLLD